MPLMRLVTIKLYFMLDTTETDEDVLGIKYRIYAKDMCFNQPKEEQKGTKITLSAMFCA